MSVHQDDAPNDAWGSELGALGTFIRHQRGLADLSLREMASLTQVSNAYLSQIERGLHQPSLKVLRAIGDALNIDAQDLLGQAGFGLRAPSGDGEPDTRSDAGDTEATIMSDPRLNDEQRRALVGVYRSFLDRDTGAPGGAGGATRH